MSEPFPSWLGSGILGANLGARNKKYSGNPLLFEIFEVKVPALPKSAPRKELPGHPTLPFDSMNVIDKIEREQMKEDIPEFAQGDTVNVHSRVVEGGKERIQVFKGIVIGRKGGGINSAFTVRKISNGEGVERVFQVHSPKVAKIEVLKRGKVRRAKLNYLRDRVGKAATNLKERAK